MLEEKKPVNPEFQFQQKYPLINKKILFSHERKQRIWCLKIFTLRNTKGSSLGRGEMIPKENGFSGRNEYLKTPNIWVKMNWPLQPPRQHTHSSAWHLTPLTSTHNMCPFAPFLSQETLVNFEQFHMSLDSSLYRCYSLYPKCSAFLLLSMWIIHIYTHITRATLSSRPPDCTRPCCAFLYAAPKKGTKTWNTSLKHFSDVKVRSPPLFHLDLKNPKSSVRQENKSGDTLCIGETTKA